MRKSRVWGVLLLVLLVVGLAVGLEAGVAVAVVGMAVEVTIEVVAAVAGMPLGADVDAEADEAEEGRGGMASAGPYWGGRPWDIGSSGMTRVVVVGTGSETEAVNSAAPAAAAGGLKVVEDAAVAGAGTEDGGAMTAEGGTGLDGEAARAAAAAETEDDAMMAEGGTGLEGRFDMAFVSFYFVIAK